jgi:outer membrane receptor for ferrienterochelin and colicin
MQIRRLKSIIVVLGAFAMTAMTTNATAQGITTGAISGFVLDSAGNGIEGAQIQVINPTTGFSARTMSRVGGRYQIQGLEVGGPYTITARRIGFNPQTNSNLTVGLTQNLRSDFRLSAQATTLSGIEVRSTVDVSPSSAGTRTIVSDSALARLPNLTRNISGFIATAPQVSVSGPGYSAGGMSNRMNNVQLDGSTERDVFGLGSTGTPGAETNSKTIPIDAVKELQILLAPYDVRQGNFGGLLLNAVTKAGTNNVQGSAYTYYRNQNYGRNVPTLRATETSQKTFGFTLGGPIVKDRLHFFIAPEWKREETPFGGPYLGQPSSATTPFPTSPDSIARFESIMKTKYNFDPGTAGIVNVPNPVNNFFGRLDFRFNEMHRAVFHYNYANSENPARSQRARSSSESIFSSNFHDFTQTKHAPVFQLFSNFGGGSSNELFLGYNRFRGRRVPPTTFPQVRVAVPRTGGGTAFIYAGGEQFSQTNELDTDTYELTDNYTRPFGSHTFTFGTRNELVKLRNLFRQSSFGVWQFPSLVALENNAPNSFRRAFILRDSGNVYFDALQSALYVQDQWSVSQNFSLTLGLRGDISKFLTDVPYSAPIDSAYGRRTDDIPKSAIQFSPRVGWHWDITGNQVNIFRGGVGLFVGTPPYVWLENAYVNSGSIITFLNCASAAEPPPQFNVDPTIYQTCANGAGSKPIGAVNFLNKDLKFPQPLRTTIGFDRILPANMVFTLEGLYSKTLNQFFFVNRNLRPTPRGVDLHGRLLYGDTILTTGTSRVSLPDNVRINGGVARFSEAIDIVNQSHDFAYNLTVALRKQYSDNWQASAAYTYSRARDVQSFTSSTHISNWQFGRTLSGDHQDPNTTVSLFDQPHKITLNGTYTFHWLRNFATDVSLLYAGTSGAPHDYIYGAGPTSGSGDLNDDGVQGNDLIYVPKDATDASEILFRDSGSGANLVTAAAQATAFEAFIKNSPCLSENRGRILARNSCRLPFTHNVDLALRQSIPTVSGQRLSIEFDIFNFGNLLNKKWGKVQINQSSSNSAVPILTHVGQTGIDPKTAQSIFTFSTTAKEYVVGDFPSSYWRSQLSLRYSF